MSGYLIHYASPYYDPVKAHEYYEEHKKLKGRKSTKGLNEKGLEAAQYAKSKIDEERKRELEDRKNTRDSDLTKSKSRYDSTVESAANRKDTTVKAHTDRTKRAISVLQDKISKMSSAEKARNRGAIQNQIQHLRESNAAQKAQLTAQYNKTKVKAKESYTSEKTGINAQYKKDVETIKSKYDDIYLNELDKLKADSEFTGKSSKSSRVGSGSSSKPKHYVRPEDDADRFIKELRENVKKKKKD